MNWLALRVLTPDAAPQVRTVAALDVPAAHGRLTVLPGHAPLLCALRPGRVRVTEPDGSRSEIGVGPGMLHIDTRGATLIVDSAAAESG